MSWLDLFIYFLCKAVFETKIAIYFIHQKKKEKEKKKLISSSLL